MKGLVLVAAALVAVGAPAGPPAGPQPSRVIPWSATPDRYAWGEMRKAFTGETYGTKNLFVSSFVLQPGATVHAPHRHSQEELMTIESGSGLWHLDGRDIPAAKGDVIYCAPFSLHGLKNTGQAPLVYFVVQFHSKGIEPPQRPVP